MACEGKHKAPLSTDRPVAAKNCVPAKTWTAMPTENAPHINGPIISLWVEHEWLVFGENPTLPPKPGGGIYDACTNTWRSARVESMPAVGRTAPIVAGTYVVWLYSGIESDPSPAASKIAAVVYDVTNDKWREYPLEGPLAPPRVTPAVVWSGKELLVWGGSDANHAPMHGGAAIDLATGNVRALSTAGEPTPDERELGGWLGSQMFVWGTTNTEGGLYDPVANTWKPVSKKSAPPARKNEEQIGVANGKAVIFRGTSSIRGGDNDDLFASAFYDPKTDTWTELPTKDGLIGVRLIGDSLLGEGAPTSEDIRAGIYKIGDKPSWRKVEPEPGDGWPTSDPFVSIRRKQVGGDSGPELPVAIAKFDPASGTWSSIPVDDPPMPKDDAGVPGHISGHLWGGNRYIAYYLDVKELPPAPCPKQKCESYDTAQFDSTLRGWIHDY